MRIAFEYYSAARALGVDIDIVAPGVNLDDRDVVLLPAMPIVSADARAAIEHTNAHRVFGPRYDSRDHDHLQKHPELPTAVKIRAIDGIRPGIHLGVKDAPTTWYVRDWLENLETSLPSRFELEDGRGLLYADDQQTYVNAELSSALLRHVLSETFKTCGIETRRLPQGLRYRQCGDVTFAFNYGPEPVELPRGELLFGSSTLRAGEVTAWR